MPDMSKSQAQLGGKATSTTIPTRKVSTRSSRCHGIGTLPWGDGKFRYFALIVDLSGRYVEIVPLEDQTATSNVQAFKWSWIFRGHGVPDVLLTDQGRNVDGEEIRTLCRKLGIQKCHSSPYHPQGDGMAERNVGSVKQVIRCLLMGREMGKDSWPSVLPEVSFVLNNVRNSTTKISPHMITYGRKPRAPTDIWAEHRDASSDSLGEYFKSLQER